MNNKTGNKNATLIGFRKGLESREALFGLNVLVQICLHINQHVHGCFIDFEKAFNKVGHEQLRKLHS